MDQALRHIAKLKNRLVGDEELVRAAWRVAVGEKIEAHAHFRELIRDRMVIEVGDRVWQSQLMTLERQILTKLEKLLGRQIARQIEYRIAIPRRMPQSAATSDTNAQFQLELTHPEARRISDPGLRRMYLKSKRRAIAG
ncbi:DciA family protein [Bryobacter aggregatus]|uniref:DciA family protein n=1 Tax=Bryobacter aggregatus TaxID=360054 RepID=UPI0012BA75B4|nr:DciA family protein [Bryobacter aggregatus]